MHYENVVVAMERKRGWDMLLCADTHHYAVGVLAREMSCVSTPLRSRIVRYLPRLLHTQEPHWDLPALAFLVEALSCLDLSEGGLNRVLKILSRHLHSERRERRDLALRGFLELIEDSSMINGKVQLVSILLFRKLVTVLTEKDKKALKTHVCRSLLLLFFHCHNENWLVLKASWATLIGVAKFLKRENLENLMKKKLRMFAECLLAEDRSRAAEHLRRVLPYLQKPQEPLRAAAIRFMGTAAVLRRGQQEELQVLCEPFTP
ncbi:uncharacterized protein LOC134562728 [Prinia subflava]|uniref:uncharacterized protein LOC134562728 n=1 Tax=Prinia subflava TaxID=208062 RepID=UPI002FE29556